MTEENQETRVEMATGPSGYVVTFSQNPGTLRKLKKRNVSFNQENF
jgi:hypothetical protein